MTDEKTREGGWFDLIGTRRFWMALGALAFVVLAIVVVKYRRVMADGAPVPIVTLTGPSEASPGETARFGVLVRDRYGAPLPDVPVRVGFVRYGLTELGRATTGPSGDATIAVRFPDDFEEERVLHASADTPTAEGADEITVAPHKPDRASVFVSTDKPLYQPGQTIHIRGLAMADEKPVGNRPATIEIRTDDDTKVFRAEKTTSEFGVVSVDFALADQVKLGSYRIYVSTSVLGPKLSSADGGVPAPIKVNGARSVEVKRYSLPKVQVAFEDLSPLHADEPLTGVVHATWIFGEPVTGQDVHVSLGERSALGKLDASGRFRFELKPNPNRKPKDQPRGNFALSALVELGDGTAKTESMRLTTRERTTIRLEAFPENPALSAGTPQYVHVVTSDGPMAGVTVTSVDATEPAKTGEHGVAKLRVVPRYAFVDGNPAPLKITATDEYGGEGTVEVLVREEGLVVRPDHEAYDAGKPARVTVLGAKTGDRIALRMTKGAEPVAVGTCAVTDEKAGCVATLDLPKDVSGLVWLHALSMPAERRHHVLTGKRLAMVGGGSRDLTLALKADKPAHTPRESGVVDVSVTGPGGAPVKAQLGVAVADEAVFALAQVRPDLEKIFFTIDQDVQRTQRTRVSSWGSQSYRMREEEQKASPVARMPERFEVAEAYDPMAADDVRGAILAVLSTMPDQGAPAMATTESLLQRGWSVVGETKAKLTGWLELVFAVFALVAFGCFGAYGVLRLRGRELQSISSANADAFRVETRALYIDWLVAALGPPVLSVAGAVMGDMAGGPSVRGEYLGGTWIVLALFFSSFLLVRAVLRVRRTVTEDAASVLRRVIVFLPVGAFFAHACVLLTISDQGKRLGLLFDVPKDGLFLPAAVVLAAQLVCGFLSVIRATLLGPVTPRRRRWLLVSRASFLGLPFSLAFVVFLVWAHVKTRRTTWADYVQEMNEAEYASDNSDNKEGGTGTRAKGEEGSMGNPNTRATARAFGLNTGSSQPVLRDQFPETLLWAPEVITDDAGHAQIKVPFADSITTWRFGVNAVSRGGQLGNGTLALPVKQDFFVDATLPPTLTQGDEIALPVTVFSYLPTPQDIQLVLESDGFAAVGPSSTTLRVQPGQAQGFRFTVRAEKAGDRAVRVKALGPTRSDALERKVAIVPNGLALTKTKNVRVTGAAATKATFPQGAIEGGNDLFLKVYGGPLSQVSEGLDGVFQVPHGCFEQTSSVTYPSVLALDFLKRTKRMSPDVERRAREYIAQGVQRLLSFEVGSGQGFSLFGRSPASVTLSAYGLMEFSDLARTADIDPAVLQRTRTWLYSKRSARGGWIRPTLDPRDTQPTSDDVLTTAFVAWALARVSLPNDTDANLGSVLDVVSAAKGPEAGEPYALVLRANALVAGGRAEAARPLLDRLVTLVTRDDHGAHWSSKNVVGVLHSYGESLDVEITGLAVHVLARTNRDPDLRNAGLDWLVERRTDRGIWSTTTATVAAMRALLDEAKPSPSGVQDVSVLVDGELAETVHLDPAGRDVHHLVSLRRWANTGEHGIEVKATGEGDVSYQLVARHYVPWQRTPGKSPLSLDVGYTPSSVSSGSIVNVHVKLAWSGDVPGRMPIAEIAIPPAFEVANEDLDKLVTSADSRISRTALEHGKVTLYLVDLPQKSPLSVDLPMRALRRAKVVAPASEAWLYYEPGVRAETGPVTLVAQ